MISLSRFSTILAVAMTLIFHPAAAQTDLLEEAKALDQNETQFYQPGNYQKAAEAFEHSKALKQKALGPDHPEGAVRSGQEPTAMPSPRGRWKLDEGSGTIAADTTYNANDGELIPGPSPGSSPPNWSTDGPSLAFSNGGRIRVPRSAVLEPARAITVEAWVKANRSPGNYKYIVGKGAQGCYRGSYGLYTGTSGGLAFYIATRCNYVVSHQRDPPQVWDGKWHHAAGVYDGSRLWLYIDGVPIDSDGMPIDSGASTAGAPIDYGMSTIRTSKAGSDDLFIGAYGTPCGSPLGLPFEGNIAGVHIDGSALDASAIAQHARGGIGP
jgi:hypothetical protein